MTGSKELRYFCQACPYVSCLLNAGEAGHDGRGPCGYFPPSASIQRAACLPSSQIYTLDKKITHKVAIERKKVDDVLGEGKRRLGKQSSILSAALHCSPDRKALEDSTSKPSTMYFFPCPCH